MLGIPGMRERTIKIGSAGKIFSLTGWKVGLVAAAPDIMKVLAKAHQFLTFTTAPNLQIAVAYGLGKEDAYFKDMRAAFQRSRDRFIAELETMGFDVLPSHGTYFVNIDLSALSGSDDVSFADRLVREFGVATIPVSAFYAAKRQPLDHQAVLRKEGFDARRRTGKNTSCGKGVRNERLK
jgi:N-succinyldiaminopimelate aminotransferase